MVQLTQNKKAKSTPLIMERDFPNKQEPFCIFCEGGFMENHKHYRRVWEHLNNDETDSRFENLAWAHAICNQQKKNDYDMQIKAHEKLKENVLWSIPAYMGEREGEKIVDIEELTDTEVGKLIDKTTKTFLDERLKRPNPKSFLPRADTRACITLLIKKETCGRGSHQAVDRAIDNYCCSIGDYISLKEDGTKIIRLRTRDEII